MVTLYCRWTTTVETLEKLNQRDYEPQTANITSTSLSLAILDCRPRLHVGMECDFWKTGFTRYLEPDNAKNWLLILTNAILRFKNTKTAHLGPKSRYSEIRFSQNPIFAPSLAPRPCMHAWHLPRQWSQFVATATVWARNKGMTTSTSGHGGNVRPVHGYNLSPLWSAPR